MKIKSINPSVNFIIIIVYFIDSQLFVMHKCVKTLKILLSMFILLFITATAIGVRDYEFRGGGKACVVQMLLPYPPSIILFDALRKFKIGNLNRITHFWPSSTAIIIIPCHVMTFYCYFIGIACKVFCSRKLPVVLKYF